MTDVAPTSTAPATPPTPPPAPPEVTAPPPAAGAPPPDTAKKPSAAEVLERALATDKKVRAERDALKAEQAKLKAEREAWEAERGKVTSEAQRAAQLTKLLKENPVKFLDEAGVSFEDFRAALESGTQLDPRVAEINDKLARIEEAERKREEEAKARAAEAERAEQDGKRAGAIAQFRATVDAAKDRFGLTAHYFETSPESAAGLLQDIATQLHEETGKVPGFEEAAAAYESALVDDTKARLSIPSVRALAIEILKAELGSVSDDKQQAQQATPGTAPADGPPTITNDHAAQPGPRGATAKTRKQRFEKLVAAARKDGLGR